MTLTSATCAPEILYQFTKEKFMRHVLDFYCGCGELTADCSISWAARRWNSEVELVDGKGLSGTGLPRNSHSGSQPSATSNCSRRWAGIVLFTSALWRS